MHWINLYKRDYVSLDETCGSRDWNDHVGLFTHFVLLQSLNYCVPATGSDCVLLLKKTLSDRRFILSASRP
jgi:hypothetical protein